MGLTFSHSRAHGSTLMCSLLLLFYQPALNGQRQSLYASVSTGQNPPSLDVEMVTEDKTMYKFIQDKKLQWRKSGPTLKSTCKTLEGGNPDNGTKLARSSVCSWRT